MPRSTPLRFISLRLLLLALCLFCCPAAAQLTPQLTRNIPVLGSLAANGTAYHSFAASAVSYQQTTLISVAASIGSPSLYVSLSDPQPFPSFDYAASWQTGGVVSISGTQPPYIAYIAVVASPYSLCNYTILATTYDTAAVQSIPVPLVSAQPVASAIAAGEYRYFTYTVAAGVSVFTVALTEAYGQSFLFLNSPDTTQLPTVDAAEYASIAATFPLIAVPQPVAGVWTVAVWSNASSAFTISATDGAETTPMELGLSYPGYVEQGSTSYYSTYLDQLLLTANNGNNSVFTVELYSVGAGNTAQLFCSTNSSQPSATDYQWRSQNYFGDDRVHIPTARLSPGFLYCGVYGWSTATYVISTTFGASTILTAGVAVTVEAQPRSLQLFSLVFPSVDSLVSVSIVSELGTTSALMGGYGPPPGINTNALVRVPEAASQALQIRSSRLCGTIPGSSPPLCELQLAVTSPTLGLYRIVVVPSGELVQLTPGEVVEGAAGVNQPFYLQFAADDDLANITVVVTVLNGVEDVTLSVGSKLYGVNSQGVVNTPWVTSQQPGSNVLLFTLDYTDPKLRYISHIVGEYTAILSTASDNATFSVLYPPTHRSIYSESIIELQDGVPQTSVVGRLEYNFFYFAPPLTGWPFVITIQATFPPSDLLIPAYVLAEIARPGPPQPRPLLYGATWDGARGRITLNPTGWPRPCNPLERPDCAYSIAVQGHTDLLAPIEYTLVVTTSYQEMELYVGQPPVSIESTAASQPNYFVAGVSVDPSAASSQLLFAVLMTSGTVTVSMSNASVLLGGASSPQLTWTGVSNVSVLSYPLSPSLGYQQAHAVITCTSSDVPCAYTVQAQSWQGQQFRVSATSAIYAPPAQLILPAGAMGWVAYDLSKYVSLSYIVMEAEASVGSPQLFAGCIDYPHLDSVLPNETTSMWQASAATPYAIELFNFTQSDTPCSYLVVGVRASGGQALVAGVSVSVAGVTQTIRSTFGFSDVTWYVGVNTLTYPTSYFHFDMPNSVTPSSVLAFTIASSLSTCSMDQLRMVVSDTYPQPDVNDASTFNISRSPVTLANDGKDLTLAITSYSQPAGSLHRGGYWLAVTSSAPSSCEYNIKPFLYSSNLLAVNRLRSFGFGYWSALYLITEPIGYNTTTSLAVSLYGQAGRLAVYVGINNTPSPDDPSTYLFSTLYDTTLAPSNKPYWAAPLTVPASACASIAADKVGQPCTIVLFVDVSVYSTYQSIGVQPLSSANNTALVEGRVDDFAHPVLDFPTFELSLPASSVLVTLSINSSSAVLIVFCSYRYVTPSDLFSDWSWVLSSPSGRGGANYTVHSLNITWSASDEATPLQPLNAGTTLAELPTTCYCSVGQTSSEPFTISYTTTALSSNIPPQSRSSSSSSSSSAAVSSATPPALSSASSSTAVSYAPRGDELASGAMVAAVVVPVVVVLLLLAGMLVWWLRQRRVSGGLCCCGGSSKEDSQRFEAKDEHSVAMSPLSSLGHMSNTAQSGMLSGRLRRSD